MIEQWAQAFAVTLAIELVVATWILGRALPLLRRAGVVLFAQLATHPLVWFVLPSVASSRLGFLLIAETWAIVAELILYRLAFSGHSWARVLAASALANGASLWVGSLIF